MHLISKSSGAFRVADYFNGNGAKMRKIFTDILEYFWGLSSRNVRSLYMKWIVVGLS